MTQQLLFFVLFSCFLLLLHFLTSLIKLHLWLKFFYTQKAGRGQGGDKPQGPAPFQKPANEGFFLHSFSFLIFIFIIYLFTWLSRVLVVASRIQFPDQELNLDPLYWECRVLATGPPGKFRFVLCFQYTCMHLLYAWHYPRHGKCVYDQNIKVSCLRGTYILAKGVGSKQ